MSKLKFFVSPGIGVFFREVQLNWDELEALLRALDDEARQAFKKPDYCGEFSEAASFAEVWKLS